MGCMRTFNRFLQSDQMLLEVGKLVPRSTKMRVFPSVIILLNACGGDDLCLQQPVEFTIRTQVLWHNWAGFNRVCDSQIDTGEPISTGALGCQIEPVCGNGSDYRDVANLPGIAWNKEMIAISTEETCR